MSISDLAEKLHSNLYGQKKDDIILQIAMNSNLQNRISISQYYKAAYDKSLFEDINSRISGDFGYCAAQMFLTPLEFCLHHLKIGLKKGNECAFEMLTSKTPEELKIIENAYKRSSGNELKDDIKKVFSGSVGNNLLNLFDTPRLSNPKPRKNECEKYANKLIKKIQKIGLMMKVYLKKYLYRDLQKN